MKYKKGRAETPKHTGPKAKYTNIQLQINVDEALKKESFSLQ